jgi:restriction system protein
MIPDYQSVMLPLLKYAGDKEEHHIRDAIERLADEFKLTEEERKELLPSGLQAIFNNRVGWANTYLKKAGLLESTRRGHFRISDRGLKVLEKPPKEINVNYLEQYPEFIDFRGASKASESELDKTLKDTTPEELIGIGHQKLQADLASELLDRIKDCSPSFFEKIVVELLVKMGYGGSRQDAGKAIGKSHDEGIDVIIKEDKLGLDIVSIFIKRRNGRIPSAARKYISLQVLYRVREQERVFL